MNFKGFTLIEVIITLTLISLIAVCSVISYEHHFLKMKQTAVKLDLLMMAEEIEHYFDSNQTYEGLLLKKLKYEAKAKDYTIKILKSTEQGYQLAAIPRHSSDADQCGIFYLDQDGNKSVSGTAQECW